MATSSDQVHGQEYVDFDEYIDIQLRKTGSTIKTTDVLTAVVGILTLVTLYLLLFVICDHWLVPGGFGPVFRGIMLAIVGSAACGWLVVKVVVPWRRRVSGLYAASTIEKASPALKSSLLNLVDISRSGYEVSPEIYHSIERRAALALTHVDVNEAVDRRSLLRLSNVLLAVVVLFCLYWIFSPKNPATSLWRAMVPSADVGVATRTEIFNVRPGDKDVLARSQLEVTADIRGEVPAQTFLYFTTADRKFVDERIEMRLENESTRKFRCVLTGDNGGGILQNMTYRIVAGGCDNARIQDSRDPAPRRDDRVDPPRLPRIHAPRAGRADDGRDRRAGGDSRHAQGSRQHAPTLSGVAAVLRRRNGLEAGRRDPDPRHRRDEARGGVETRNPLRRHVSALLSHFLHEHGGRVRPQPESLQPGHSARSAARNPPPRSHDRSGAAGQRRFAACHRSPRSRLSPCAISISTSRRTAPRSTDRRSTAKGTISSSKPRSTGRSETITSARRKRSLTGCRPRTTGSRLQMSRERPSCGSTSSIPFPRTRSKRTWRWRRSGKKRR